MSSNFIEIDTHALGEWIEGSGMSANSISEKLGRSRSYFYHVLKTGHMAQVIYRFLLQTFDLPEGSFIPKPEPPKPEPPKPEPPKPEPVESNAAGWTTTLQVWPNKVRFAVLFNGKEVRHAFADIRGDSETRLMKAISYAAHMCYKFSEQYEIRDK